MLVRKLRSTSAVLMVLLLLVTGCGTPISQEDNVGKNKEKPIIIGATLPLTGAFAETAKWAKAGYELWAEDVNARGGIQGRTVELKLIDDEGKADKGVQLLEKLISVDKVDLILGGYGGHIVAAQAPIAEKYQYTYVGMGGHGPSFVQGYKYFFGGPPLMAEWYPLAVLDWVKSLPTDQRPANIGMINVNNVIGKGLQSSAKEYIGKNLPAVKLVMDELHDSPLATAEALATKVKQNKVEFLMIGNNLQDSALILRALKAQNYQPKMIWSGIGPSVPDWSKQLGKLGDNVMTGAPVVAEAGPGAAKLNDLSMKKFNVPANAYFVTFFNYGAVLEAAINGTKSFDNTMLRDWLRKNSVETPLGTFKFDEQGLPEPVSFMMQVQNGTAVVTWPKNFGKAGVIYPMPAWD